MRLREHRFLGMTQSLCPECLAVVPAKIIVKGESRVYFRKRCPTHGVREDFVCSDVSQYDRMEFSLPGKAPLFGVEPDKGCPLDCGLCTEHEQHTCVGLVEITAACNLTCPVCYAGSGPGPKASFHRRMPPGHRSARAGRNAAGSAAAFRRRADDPSGVFRNSRLRMCPADRHRDDQHERDSARSRRPVRRTSGSLQTSAGNLSAIRRLQRCRLSVAARRAAGGDQAAGRRKSRPARTAHDARDHASAGRQ